MFVCMCRCNTTVWATLKLCAQVIYDKPSCIQKNLRFILSVTIVSMFFWTGPPFASACEGALASASHEMLEHAGKQSCLSCHWIVEVVFSQVLSSSCFFTLSPSVISPSPTFEQVFHLPFDSHISEPVCLFVGGPPESHDYRNEPEL